MRKRSLAETLVFVNDRVRGCFGTVRVMFGYRSGSVRVMFGLSVFGAN